MSEAQEIPPPSPARAPWPEWPALQRRARLQFAQLLETLHGLFEWKPFHLVGRFDPLAPSFRPQVRRALIDSARDTLPMLQDKSGCDDAQRVLINVYAWSLQTPGLRVNRTRLDIIQSMCVMVLCSAMADADNKTLTDLAMTLAQRLQARSKTLSHWKHLLNLLDDNATGLPPLHHCADRLAPGIQLRWRLASLHHQRPNAGMQAILREIAGSQRASVQVISRELRRHLSYRSSIGSPVLPLRPSHIEHLTDRELMLLVKRPETLTVLFTGTRQSPLPDHLSALAERAQFLLSLYPVAQQALADLNTSIQYRDWPQASRDIATLQRLNLPPAWLHRALSLRLLKSPDTRQAEDGLEAGRRWQPLCRADAVWLETAVGAPLNLNVHPSASIDGIVTSLLDKRLEVRALSPLEHQLIFNALEERHWHAIDLFQRHDLLRDHGPLWNGLGLARAFLLSAGSGKGKEALLSRLVHDCTPAVILSTLATLERDSLVHPAMLLPARAVLSARAEHEGVAADNWYLPWIGSDDWNVIAHHFPDCKPCLSTALEHAMRGHPILDRSGFFSVLQTWNRDVGQHFEARHFDIWCELAAQSARDAFAALPHQQAIALLGAAGDSRKLSEHLHSLHYPPLESHILLARARQESDPARLLALVSHPHWMRKAATADCAALDVAAAERLPALLALHSLPAATDPQMQVLHILAVRHDAKAIQQAARQLGSKMVEDALWKAAEQLQGSTNSTNSTNSGDQAFLQLLALLGGDLAPQLAWVLLQASRSDASAFDSLYSDKTIAKKSGGQRKLRVPHPVLKKLQRRLLDRVLAPLGAHPAANGFVKGRHIVNNARVHVGKQRVASCDIRNCFPSVSASRVHHALRRDVRDPQGRPLAQRTLRWLTQLCCTQAALPMGAPTSPALLNRILVNIDEALACNARDLGCDYTRYADDLCFSGGDRTPVLIGSARRLLATLGLSLDPAKTNIFRRGRRQIVTGLCVNTQVSVPRHRRRQLRAALHRLKQSGNTGQAAPHINGQTVNAAQLAGHVTHHRFVERARNASAE